MKLLVVGGAGYIGSITTELLLRQGAEVVVYDNFSTGHRHAVPADAVLFQGELGDGAALDRVLSEHKIDAVMHFAACILVGESMEQPARYFTNNVADVINLLNAMLRNGVMRFIFSSSAAVYGEPEIVPIPESAPMKPNNPYGETKLIVERILEWYSRLLDFRYVALRYFNAAGASGDRGEDHPTETHLIPIVLEAALGKRKAVSIFGADYPTPDGTCVRDYIHVLDLAQAHILALHSLDRGSHVYNLGNGNGHSVREVIEVARRVTGLKIPVVEGPRRAGDPASLVASSTKAMKELGWRPAYADLTAIVGSAWEWRSRHPDGYRQ